MVYGRKLGSRELNFEASGALLKAGLVMRDRETDSWWSIMTSDAIGGPLDGSDLEELPFGEKTTWSEWLARHPSSEILSVEGQVHVANNPYDNYFNSEGTFRDLEIEDNRLRPKESIFSFWLEDKPYAVTHQAIEGGKVFEAEGRALFFHRTPGSSFYASSTAYLLGAADADASPQDLAERVASGDVSGLERLAGFDTFWYSWVAVNADTRLLD